MSEHGVIIFRGMLGMLGTFGKAIPLSGRNPLNSLYPPDPSMLLPPLWRVSHSGHEA